MGLGNFIWRKGIVDMADIDVKMQMDEQLKIQADKLFADLGLNMASAVNLFVRQAVREQQIPFAISKEVRGVKNKVPQLIENGYGLRQELPVEGMIEAAEMLEPASAKTYSMGIHKV